MTEKNPKKNLAKAGAFIALMTIPAALMGCSQESTTPVVTPETAPTTETQPTVQTSSTAIAYKNGTYQAVGNYSSPGGQEEIGVRLTLNNSIVTEATIEPKASIPMSKNFQGMFIENYSPYVIGKNINELNLTKVSGSSLTPKGFNDALTKIKAEAKS